MASSETEIRFDRVSFPFGDYNFHFSTSKRKNGLQRNVSTQIRTFARVNLFVVEHVLSRREFAIYIRFL